MYKPTSLLLFTALFFAGCATPTPYQRVGIDSNGGYSSERLPDGTYTVTFVGNTDTKIARAYDFALLRAAELVTEDGFSHFVIKSERDLTTQLLSVSAARFTPPPRFTMRVLAVKDPSNVKGKLLIAADVIRELRAKYKLQ